MTRGGGAPGESGARARTRPLRGIVASLAAISIAATVTELLLERHWNSREQLIPWVAMALLAAGLAAAEIRPNRRSLQAARLVAGSVAAASLFGVWSHVNANYDAGPLDYRYATRWDTMSEASRWWAAATKAVGPSPILAPGALALASALVITSTLRPQGEFHRQGANRASGRGG